MKDLTDPRIEQFRRPDWEWRLFESNEEPAAQGVFLIQHRGRFMLCIVSTGEGWDHVSISVRRELGGGGLPGWYDLEYIKRLFFKEDETAMQLHVPATDHISHGEVLHLWRPQQLEIPRPPGIMVGIQGLDLEKLRE